MVTAPLNVESAWKGLYRLSGAVCVIFLLYSLMTMALVLTIGGQPHSVRDIFAMLQENRLVGLLRLDVLTMIVLPTYYLLFLGICVALKTTDAASAAIAALLALAGLTLVLSTPSVTSFLSLSDRFAVATSEAQKAELLAAGEAILASDMWHSSSSLVGGLLMQTGTLLMSILMLRSSVFGRATAWTGVIAHGLDLVHILAGLVVPTAGVALMAVAGTLYLVWFPLLARDFFRLGRKP